MESIVAALIVLASLPFLLLAMLLDWMLGWGLRGAGA